MEDGRIAGYVQSFSGLAEVLVRCWAIRMLLLYALNIFFHEGAAGSHHRLDTLMLHKPEVALATTRIVDIISRRSCFGCPVDLYVFKAQRLFVVYDQVAALRQYRNIWTLIASFSVGKD